MLKAIRRRLPRLSRWLIGRSHTRSAQAGQSVVLFALAMLAMLSMLSLAVDTGNLYLQRRRAQQAADVAALAGATNWTGVIPNVAVKKPDAYRDARRVAIANGFDTNPGAEEERNGEVEVHSPPVTGLHQDQDDYVEVRIERTVPSLFGRVLGYESFTVAGWAVARVKHIAFDAATISLSEDEQSTKFQGNANIHVNGNVYSRGGLKNESNATDIRVVGDVFVRGTISNSTIIDIPPGAEIVTGTESVPYLDDPLLPPPPKPPAVFDTWKNNFSPPEGQEWVYITPGQYQSIDILPNGTQTVFCSGVYWMTKTVSFAGRAKTLPNGASREDGTECGGPIIFVLDGANARFEIVTDARVELHSDEYYDGIHFNNVLIYSATYPPTGTRITTGSCGNPVKINGGPNGDLDSSLRGTIYVPCGDAQIAGNGSGTVFGQVIANTVTFLGGSGPSVTYDADLAPETPGPTLVE